MKEMKRILSLVLCFVMVVGLLPMSVFATDYSIVVENERDNEGRAENDIVIEDGMITEMTEILATPTVLDAAIFCSDLHGETSNLVSILNQLKSTGVTYSSIGLVGDTCLTVSSVTNTIGNALGYTPKVMFSYAASHDTEGGADISDDWNYSGEVEGVSNYYLVYTIRETDMQNASGASTAAPAFTTWYNGLTDAEKALPIFIISHRPLHDRRDDNAGAATWYSAISAAAESSDIVFFWGHNHTSESSVDTAAYYVAKDGTETFTVYNGDTVVPNFTYMNAGYIDANGQNPARKPVATTVQITADSLIFQDYTTSGTYTNSSYSHNVTVAREFAVSKKVTSIEVTGETEYTVGGNGLNLTVTATYDDGTTADVTNDATFSPAELTASGVYTVTATYEGFTDTIDVTVNLYDEVLAADGETLLMSVEAFSQGATALEIAWDDAADAILYEKGIYTDYVVYDLAVTNPGETTKYAMTLADNMDTTNLVVYHVADDGTLTVVPHTVENDCVVFTTSLTGAFAYGAVAVPEGYTLQKITLAGIPTDLFVGGSLDLMNAVITATYTKEGAENFVRQLTVYDYDENNFSGYDVNVAGPQTAVFTFDGVTATLDIHVWGHDFTASNVTVHVDGSEYGVTEAVVTESTNENVASAIQYVINGDNYVAYDISLVYENGYSATEDVKTVTLPIPSGVNNPVVYYVSEDGTTVTNMNAVKDGNGNVTFTTTHFSTYVIGESTEIEVPENETATGSGSTTTTTKKTVYVLTNSISSGNDYLIVNGNSAGSYYALANNSGSVAATGVTVKTDSEIGTYIELDDATDELWTVSNSYRFQNGGYYLGYTTSGSNWSPSYTFGLSTTARTWSYSSNRLSTSVGSWNTTTYYLRYNDGWTWTSSSSASGRSVYFYIPTEVEVETTTTVSGTYSIAGEDITVVAAADGSTTANLSSTLTFTPDSGTATTTDVSTTATYEIVTVDANGNTVDGDPNDVISKIENGVVFFTGNIGKALVKVSYEVSFGETKKTVTNYITVYASAPYYELDLCKPVTDAEGNTTYESITAPVALKSIKAGDTYSLWAVIKEFDGVVEDGEDGKDIGDVEDDRIYWTVSDTTIATIDPATGVLTFTGSNYGTITVTAHYLDENGEILCSDAVTISVSATSATVPDDGTDDFPEYPNEGAVRHDKTATAVGNFSETGIAKIELSMTGVPYTTGSEIDVVVMLDMTGSMSDDGMEAAEEATKAFVKKIVVNEDGSYNGNRIAVYAFNSGSSSPYELVKLTAISSDAELETANTAIDTASDKQASGGTPYDEAAKQCYDVLQAAKKDGTGNDRQQFCVFMSDGGPTAYRATYDNTNGYLDISNSGSGTSAITTYLSGYSSSSSSSWSFTLPTEYYTDLMKADGVTVYTVGLLLQNKPSNPSPYSSMTSSTYDSTTDSLTTIGSHYYFCSSILKQMASDATKYIDIFNVDNASKATAAFESIAKDILSAATDVTVADKMGSNYTMVFDAPNAAVDAADGGQEYYIEVTDYPLVPVYAADGTTITDYTRGTGTSLLKLYFGYDATTGYYAATDADGTKAATPTFDTVTLGDKGTKYYWTTTAADGDSGISVVGADGTTYYFVSSGNGSHNMTAGAYASGTNTTVNLTYDDGTTGTSVTCQNMIIASPYFVYNAQTKMLIWTMEEIASSEMTLTYFLYLNNSGGFSGTDKEIEPKTYETNQFAYVDYSNYKGNECLLEFPKPQMTWNGAQVSYVFYLVNEAGQPVNRAGRVVPFSEAVYVTAVYTHSIVWNDLEQTAGLEAERLAADLVPDVYELFDKGAEYNIHVYEDQDRVNLNNHFMIKSSVDSDENTVNNGVYTTYVFNTKADGRKYTVPGTYVVDNGNNTAYQSGQTYWCKSYAVTGTFEKTEHTDELYGTYYTYTVTSATYTGNETRVPVSSMQSTTGGTVIDGYVYYVDENEKIYTIVQKTDGNEVEAGFDFSNTTVAFAVVWKPELVEDTVVVDFGLDVIIDVTTNDALASGVVGVRTDAPDVEINKGTYNSAKANTVDLMIDGMKIGTASVENFNAVRFSLDKTNGMQFTEPVVFYYESDVNYYKDNVLQTTSMYSSVTVIPATTVYYEDDFLVFKSYTKNGDTWEADEENKWVISAQSGTQQQDRPGASKISAALDADNSYGYDKTYANMSQFSMGSAAMIEVNEDTYGTATFTFCGTGFDVISLTSSNTGTILVEVKNAADETVKNGIVDTYYGYSQDEEGNWVVDAGNTAMYQVPVIKYFGMDYGTYTVTITAAYNQFFDHTSGGSYELYLDAIRVYDPTGNESDVANEAYAADGEYLPNYFELRDKIISPDAIIDDDGNVVLTENTSLPGIVFIDGSSANASIEDYTNYGPNNELYLASGQSITFDLEVGSLKSKEGNVLSDYETVVHIGLKSVGSTAAVAGLWNAEGGEKVDEMTVTLNTATDMYYDISALPGGTVVITNSGETGSILSITNIKVSYRFNGDAEKLANPDDVETPDVVLTVTKETVEQAVATLPIEQVFVPIEVEIVDQPTLPVKPLKPVQPGKPSVPALPELPTDPIKPIRSIQKAAVSVSFEETVIGSRRVIG